MRIRSFCVLVEKELKPLALRDAAVVVDGQNYLYDSYRDSALAHQLGCESDAYARFLRQHLAMYRRANVTCYFLFKGGHKNIEQRLQRYVEPSPLTAPIFMWEVYKEVLTEMGINYVVCEYESKRETVALAQTLNCPIISYDVEFCFSGLKYIPKTTLNFEIHSNSINCRYFSFDDFLGKYRLTEEKVAVFIVLTDETIFPEDFFINFFLHIKAPINRYKQNLHIMSWLSQNSRQQSVYIIFQFIPVDDRKKFEDEEKKARQLIRRREQVGPGTAFALRRRAAAPAPPGPAPPGPAPPGPRWFAKGVAAGHVAIEYINLYHSKYFFPSANVVSREDGMLFCLDIVKYAYDLLTDFKNQAFTYVYYDDSGIKTITVGETCSVRKPNYEAEGCVFENGWDEVRERGLFEHFLSETLRGVEPRRLARVPAPARLLAAALLYFSRKKLADTTAEVAAVLLSYVTLSIVLPMANKTEQHKIAFTSKHSMETSTYQNEITKADCHTAAAIMADYVTASRSDIDNIDWVVNYPLVQFQHCLSQLNNLNLLCGAPLAPTVYHRAYNGTLVYKVASAARAAGDAARFLRGLLRPAPSVYAFVNGLIQAYNELDL